VRDEAHFDALIARRFDDGGPVLLAAKIDDQPGQTQTVRDPPLIRNRFMMGLGTGRGGNRILKMRGKSARDPRRNLIQDRRISPRGRAESSDE
jgi:hypothetical protein